jgi:hypothetical protein
MAAIQKNLVRSPAASGASPNAAWTTAGEIAAAMVPAMRRPSRSAKSALRSL